MARLCRRGVFGAMEPAKDEVTFWTAASEGELVEVARMLTAGASPGAKYQGSPALTNAAANGHLDVVQLLVRAGAKLEETDGDGYTALMAAAWNGNTSAAETLLGLGANMHTPDNGGATALHHAAKYGQLDGCRPAPRAR